MRYWIWWNDLIQGPFELDELSSMKAFSEDLLVCMEDREDWIPAGRVADLSAVIEQYRARKSQPLVPPPPPPRQPPARSPLQGEFFAEAPGQQPLLEPDEGPKGPFAYKPVQGESEVPCSFLAGQATMPFHFARQPGSTAAVIEVPRPDLTRALESAPPVIRESPAPAYLPQHREAPQAKTAVPLNILQDETIADLQVVADALPAPSILPETPSVFDAPVEPRRNLEWLPWFMGLLVVVAALGSLGYWLMDRASTRAAMAEANRLAQASPASLPVSAPSPVPAPVPVPVQVPLTPKATAVAVSPALPVEVPSAPATMRARRQTRRLIAALKKMFARSSSAVKAPAVAVPKTIAAMPLIPERPVIIAPSIPVRPAVTVRAVTRPHRKPGAAASNPTKPSRRVRATGSSATRSKAAVTPRSSVPVTTAPQKTVAGSPDQAPPAPTAGKTIALPGLAVPAPVPVATEIPAVDAPVVAPATRPRVPDPWAGQQNAAIEKAVSTTISGTKVTVGLQARMMLQQMHEKELLHAAETGERLYLPDKITWSALQEEGARYRVYLNFLAWQANGERVQVRSYQFIVDLKRKEVRADNPATQEDMLSHAADLHFKHNPMATDMDSLLGGVDTYNKHKVGMMIVKKNRTNRNERKDIEGAMSAAQTKVKRSVIYFRRTYSDKPLQNIAKAYSFTELINGQ